MDDSPPGTPSQPTVNAVPPKNDSGEEAAPPPPVRIPAKPNISPAPERKRTSEHCRPDQTPWWKHVTELAAILVGVSVAIIYNRQLNVMSEQLGEMIRQYPELHSSAEAAKTAATATKKSVEDSEVFFKIAQRPYVSPENIRFDPALQPTGNPATLKFEFRNAGRTPALRATFTIDAFVDGRKIKQAQSDFPAELVIPSDSSVGSSMSIRIGGPGDMDGIVKGTRKLSIRGIITYANIFSERRPTTFCAVYDAIVTKTWVFCPHGNDIK